MIKDSIVLKTGTVLIRLLLGGYVILYSLLLIINPVCVSDYYEIFLEHVGIDFLKPLSFVLSVFISSVIFTLGIRCFCGVRYRNTMRLLCLIFSVSLMIDVYSAIAPIPEHDLLLGEIYLFDSKTNIIISLLIVLSSFFLFWNSDICKFVFLNKTQWIVGKYVFVFGVFVSGYSYVHLSQFSFGPYDIGRGINFDFNDSISFKHKSNLYNFVTEDSLYTKIPVFSNFENLRKAEDSIDNGLCFLMIASDLGNSSTFSRREIECIYEYANGKGIPFFCLTSTDVNSVETEEFVIESGGIDFPFVNSDKRILNLISRSNPGIVLLEKGVIVGKWGEFDIPNLKKLCEKNSLQNGFAMESKFMRFLYTFTLPLILLFVVDKLLCLVMKYYNKK